ncbi:hypothetical protein D3C79_1069140 [compost metagenome]
MRPKFEVGEEVILQSVIDSQYDGEYQVTELDYDEYGLFYRLDGLPTKNVCEASLRKKHKPSRMSFDDLMSSLKPPSHV